MKEITIIIVSYNVEDLLKQCIQSIYQMTKPELFDIIVVDNNSGDASVAMIMKTFPNVRLIQNDENLGFSGANNMALRQSSSKYILLLNPDTIILNNSIEKMLEFLASNENAGAVGPQILNPDKSPQKSCRKLPGFIDALFYISGIGRVFPNARIFRSWLLPEFDYGKTQRVEYISGACIMVRKKVFDDIGLFDERFFLYSEDTDLCLRMMKNRWDILYFSVAKIIHYGGQSSNYHKNWQQAEEMFKSWLKYRKKHFSLIHSITFNLTIVTVLIMKLVYLRYLSRKQNQEKIQMYSRLIFWYLRNLV